MKKRRKAYDEIRKQYPETISKDQFYRIAHISKATALYLLQSGLVPCIDSGKKTRRYTIRTEDVITYLMEREIHPEDYHAPEMWYAKRSGRTKPRKKRCNRLKKLSETEKKHFRTYMEAKLEDYDDLLKVADVTEVIGYSSASVHLWCKNKKLKHSVFLGNSLSLKVVFWILWCRRVALTSGVRRMNIFLWLGLFLSSLQMECDGEKLLFIVHRI